MNVKLSQVHLTADKREIKDFPRFPSATSFIRGTLYEMTDAMIKRGGKHILRPIETGQGEGVEVSLNGGQGEKL